MKQLLITICLTFSINLMAQKTYQSGENVHLYGPITIEDFQHQPYAEWFNDGYEKASFFEKKQRWAKRLKDVEVEIFLGTWCGDSREWVPQFIKLWDELGLDRDQLRFIALDNRSGHYKQGPNGEEMGKKIFRVPTFIFERESQEIGRIVEYPVNSLETDIAQITLGYPSKPSYQAANYLVDLFASQRIEAVKAELNTHYYHLYKKVNRSNELNSLGYLLLGKNQMEEALIVFLLNTYLFKLDPNVYDSYAEALLKAEKYEEALINYEKALKMNPENESAMNQIAMLKEKMALL
ncbi:MAG: tetratricopeptide repeat protein [Cyclobacteriaceae bacterium]